MYTLMTLGIADGLRLLLKYPLRNFAFPGRELLFSNMGTAVVGAVCAVIISTVSIYGVLSAGNIHTTKYNISVDKKAGNMKELNVVLVADLHLGYNIGCKQMEQMTEKINEQKPDLVVVAGDIFDNEYEALDDPEKLAEILRGIRSKYGVYACYGNHDIQEKILAGFTFGSKEKKESTPEMDEFLEKAGITLLRDEYVLIDDSFICMADRIMSVPDGGLINERLRRKSQRVWMCHCQCWLSIMSRENFRNWRIQVWT